MSQELRYHVCEKLAKINISSLKDINVVLLPDFFVDHFIVIDDFNQTVDALNSILHQGGGNIPGISQTMHHGGNAANTACALACLGLQSHLICRTSPLGLHLLQYFLGPQGVDLSGVKTDGKLALTAALECRKQHANIMLGDPGSVADFSFNLLTSHDREMIAAADVLCVMNWNLNQQGTNLAVDAFEYAHKHEVKTFFDMGDPSPRKQEIPMVFKKVLQNSNLDIVGLNENELRYLFAPKDSSDEALLNAAMQLKQHIHARVDLHTSRFSCSVTSSYICVPSLPVSSVVRMTGAGDAWNAGNIFAELQGFTDEERLYFANAFSSHYISSQEPRFATLTEMQKLLENM